MKVFVKCNPHALKYSNTIVAKMRIFKRLDALLVNFCEYNNFFTYNEMTSITIENNLGKHVIRRSNYSFNHFMNILTDEIKEYHMTNPFLVELKYKILNRYARFTLYLHSTKITICYDTHQSNRLFSHCACYKDDTLKALLVKMFKDYDEQQYFLYRRPDEIEDHLTVCA